MDEGKILTEEKLDDPESSDAADPRKSLFLDNRRR